MAFCQIRKRGLDYGLTGNNVEPRKTTKPRKPTNPHYPREHNLKNVSLDLPRDKLIVVTSLSGSGKSSLAFDTILTEGQRRYVESLSAYARQFLEMMQSPMLIRLTVCHRPFRLNKTDLAQSPLNRRHGDRDL